MAIRIQPLDVEVPPDEPFKHDLLGRQEPAEVLTHLLGSIEGPCVLTIDGAWGSGKTTFLKMWVHYLDKQGFPVVQFNAWETDYSATPFISLASELASGLEQWEADDDTWATKLRDASKRIIPSLRPLASAAVLAAATAIGLDPTVVAPLPQLIASLGRQQFDDFPEAQQSVQDFKATFEEVAAGVAAKQEGRPLVVAIDELDRCRPTFAIELLETAKHLFMADHVVFVLAMNRQELCHSIKAVYGSGFDADGYLRRFVDVDFRLPEVDRVRFVDDLIKRTQIDTYFQRTRDTQDKSTYAEMLQCVFAAHRLSIRTIAQAMHRLGLVLASVPDNHRTLMGTSVLALLLRTIDERLYDQFTRHEADAEECVEALFGSLAEEERYTPPFAWLEALTIAISADSTDLSSYTGSPVDMSLVGRYLALRETPPDADRMSVLRIKHAENVLLYFERRSALFLRPDEVRNELRSAVRRIELLSPEFIADQQRAGQ